MQLGDKSDESGQLAAELTDLTGETLNVAVSRALRERLARVRRHRDRRPSVDDSTRLRRYRIVFGYKNE